MSEKVRVHNPNPYEVVIDREGHSLGGHSAGFVVPDALTDSLTASGKLLVRPLPVYDEPATEEQPEAAPQETTTKRKASSRGADTQTGDK